MSIPSNFLVGESEYDSSDGVTSPLNGRVENFSAFTKENMLGTHAYNTEHLTKKDSAFLNWY
jgi:hypothetical protein